MTLTTEFAATDSAAGGTLTSNPAEDLAYNPDGLLAELAVRLAAKNDAAIGRALGLGAPVISKIRNRHMAVSAFILIRMHEVTDLTIADLRGLMGDRRPKFAPINDFSL